MKPLSAQKVALFCLSVTFTLLPEIIEIKHFREIIPFITPTTLLLLDIDNTLLESAHPEQLGSDQWFTSLLKKHSLTEALPLYHTQVLSCPMKLVEYEIPTLIRQLHQQGILVIGFTMRSLVLAPITIQTLHSQGITFSPWVQDSGFMVENKYPVMVYHGCIFCEGQKNGNTLFTIFDALQSIDWQDDNMIIMVDDKLRYLELVEEMCTIRHKKFIGFRYGHLDEKVETFLNRA